jgi:membrane-associated phospholipid phosphatase
VTMTGRHLMVLAVAGLALGAPLQAQSTGPTLNPPRGGDLGRFLPADTFDDDGRRTMGAFGKNLGRNFVGVFAKDNLAPLLIGGSLSGAGSFLDQRVINQFGGNPSWGFASRGSTAGGGKVMLPLVSGLFVAGRFSHDGRFRAATYDMAQAFIVNTTYTAALKQAVGRPRPDLSDRQSFPSGHVSNAVALATVAGAHFGPKVGVPAYLAAGAIGVARMGSNVHHLSDVLAGATLGYIVGRTVVRQDGLVPRGKPRFQIVPSAPPTGAGVGAGVSIDW